MGFTYTYKGIEHEVDDDTKRLTTRGKYLEDDITIEAQGGGNIVPLAIAGNATYNTDSIGWMTPISFAPLCHVDNSNRNPLEFDVVVKTGSNVSTTQYIVGGSGTHGDQSSHRYQFAVCIQNGGLWIGNNLNGYGSSMASISANTEYHISLVLENSYRRLYVNGTQVWQASSSAQVDTDIETVALFANYDNLTGTLSGRFLGEAKSVELSNIAFDKFTFLKDGYLRNASFYPYPASSTSFRSNTVDGFVPVSSSVPLAKHGITLDAMFGNISSTGSLSAPASGAELNLAGVTSISSTYLFAYKFYKYGNIASVSAPDLKSFAGSYAFDHTFAENTKIIKIAFEKLETPATNGFNYFAYNATALREVSFPAMSTISSNYSFNYAFQGCTALTDVDFGNLESITGSYGLTYAFYQAYKLKNADFTKLKSVTGSTALADAFALSSATQLGYQTDYPEQTVLQNLETIKATNAAQYLFQYRAFVPSGGAALSHCLKSLKTVDGTSALAYAFNYCTRLPGIIFDSLESVGASVTSAYTTFNYAFRYTQFRTAGLINLAFPKLRQIGYSTSATSNYAHFKYAGNNSNGRIRADFPSLTNVYSWSSTASNGHFASSNFNKVYFPQVTSLGNYGQYTFNSDNLVAEIHFGHENETAIKALSGYSSRFGAGSQCSIYFDLENHITVNGTVYDRDPYASTGYDYDNDWYCWSNGTSVVWTKSEYSNVIGSNVYGAKGGSVVGTISAIS